MTDLEVELTQLLNKHSEDSWPEGEDYQWAVDTVAEFVIDFATRAQLSTRDACLQAIRDWQPGKDWKEHDAYEHMRQGLLEMVAKVGEER